MARKGAEPDERQRRRLVVAFWITLVRGVFAVALGLGLLGRPDQATPALLSFMGAYWVGMGLVSIRLGLATVPPGRRLSVLAGSIGIVAGVAVVVRDRLGGAIAGQVVVVALGAVILLTGVLHFLGMFRAEREVIGRFSWMSRVLGGMEIVLGLALIVEPIANGTVVYWAVIVWAMLGGLLLLSDAVRLRHELNDAGDL